MIYTAHVGPREEAWPPVIATESTRAAAQERCKAALRAAPPSVTKGEVRCEVRLLDTFSKRPSGQIRHVHSERQRAAAQSALPLAEAAS